MAEDVKQPTQDDYNRWMNSGVTKSHESFLGFWGIEDVEIAERYFSGYVEFCRDEILPGRYLHWKKGPRGEPRHYVVYGVGPHSERKEVLVSYCPDYGEHKGKLMFRPAYMFLVSIDKDGYRGLRFVREATDV
jgi:hypothetical protein